MALKIFKSLYIRMNKIKWQMKNMQNFQNNSKNLIFSVYKEYLEINMEKISTYRETQAKQEQLTKQGYKIYNNKILVFDTGSSFFVAQADLELVDSSNPLASVAGTKGMCLLTWLIGNV